MPLVLAIEPDLRQATILKRIVREKVHADVSVVDSPDAALGAIRLQVPDVLLLSALLSPRDEDELIAHLRALDAADHIQTHTIPQLASTAADQEDPGRGRGLFGVFRRKKGDSSQTSGCDPDLFAEEVVAYLQRAAEKKAENAAEQQSRAHQLEYLKESSAAAAASARHAEPAPAVSEPVTGSWASPFEWKPAQREAPGPVVEARTEPAPFETAPAPEPPYELPALEANTSHAAEAAADVPLHVGADQHEDLYDPRSEAIAYDTGATSAEPIPEPIPVYEEPSPIPIYEEPAAMEASADEIPPAAAEAHTDLEPADLELPGVAAVSAMETSAAEEDHDHAGEPGPAAASPAPRAAAALRLAPLAMWARSETAAPASTKSAEAAEPRTVSDELRNLMSALAVPPQVAGVSYARGCRIRRVRVPGGKERRRGDASGPVILSRRALEQARTVTPNS